MIRRPPRSTPLYSSAASDVYKRQEYEALIAGILLAKEMGAKVLMAKSYSLLVTGQVTGEFQAKDP